MIQKRKSDKFLARYQELVSAMISKGDNDFSPEIMAVFLANMYKMRWKKYEIYIKTVLEF